MIGMGNERRILGFGAGNHRRSPLQARMRGEIAHEAEDIFVSVIYCNVKSRVRRSAFDQKEKLSDGGCALGFEDGSHGPSVPHAGTRGENLHGTEKNRGRGQLHCQAYMISGAKTDETSYCEYEIFVAGIGRRMLGYR